MKHSDIFIKAAELNEGGHAYVMITVVEKRGSGPAETGSRMIVTSGGDMFGTVGGGSLEKLALKEAAQILLSGENSLKKYILDKDKAVPDTANTGMLCGGEVSLFFEYNGAGEKVYIFGAGHIGTELVHYLGRMDYRLVVFDDREEVLAGLNCRGKAYYEKVPDIFGQVETLDNCFIVIATHSHELDYTLLKNILERKYRPRYLAVVASGRKIESMMTRLESEVKSPFRRDFLFSPAGLDIGGRTPAEIALSISAEIQAVRYEKGDLKRLSKDFRD